MKTNTKQATTKDIENLLDEDYKETMQKRTEERRNRFSNEPALLPWFAVAVYDVIIGSEQAEEYETVRKGLDWFRKYFAKEYMVLLD